MSEANLQHRGEQMAKGAIGKKFRIRTGKNIVTEGIITECKVNDIRRAGACSIKVVWKIVMECGINKVKREFCVSTLPQ